MRTRICFLVALAVFMAPYGLKAQGVFDFLDPCIGARASYWEEHGTLVHNINFQIEAVNSTIPTDRFRGWWWGEKRAAMVPYFEREIWPMLAQSGATNKPAGFGAWMDRQVAQAGGQAKMEQLMTTEFRRLRRLVLEEQKGATLEELDETREEIYGACPEDVANQIVRGAQVLIGAPVGIMSRNLEISKRESPSGNYINNCIVSWSSAGSTRV